MKKVSQTRQFLRDVNRMQKRGKRLEKLQEIVNLLADGSPLPANHKDHPLIRPWHLSRDCHIEARSEDLLPIQYFHVVFTIPSELNPLVLTNRKVMYDLHFRAAPETLVELANDPKHLGAKIGGVVVLHTWGQNLMDHPHVHCIVTGGGLFADGNR